MVSIKKIKRIVSKIASLNHANLDVMNARLKSNKYEKNDLHAKYFCIEIKDVNYKFNTDVNINRIDSTSSLNIFG